MSMEWGRGENATGEGSGIFFGDCVCIAPGRLLLLPPPPLPPPPPLLLLLLLARRVCV
jgi:hypothetical protein